MKNIAFIEQFVLYRTKWILRGYSPLWMTLMRHAEAKPKHPVKS